jgi:hypothetical protein
MRRSCLVIALLAASITGGTPPASASQSFITGCKPSHRAPDDPIVFPLQAGASHSHDFFGNRSTGADSTYESMIGQATTCEEAGDTAGYWAPTLLDATGQPIPARRVTVYYRDRPRSWVPTTAFPPDFRMIAGSPVTAGQLTGWNCDGTALSPTAAIDCSGEDSSHQYVRGSIIFPMCGQRDASGAIVTDSPDHRSHVVFVAKAKTGCPADHPVQLPAIKVNIRFDVTICIAAGCYLSSDHAADCPVPGCSLHADFWNTWDQATLENLVNTKLNS